VGPWPMAASAALTAVLTGPPRPVTVAAASARAVYLATGDPECPALCLLGPGAVRVPCGLVVPWLPAPAPGTVGRGRLRLGCFEGRVTRWWRPPRPRGLAAGPLRGVVRELSARVPPAGPPDERLLGLGPGLTPLHDDRLAGALVTLAALGAPEFDRLGAAVRALAPRRTSFVSAALLHHAAHGECIAELEALLTAPRDGRPVAAAVDSLLAVGHSSGTGLAQGVLATLVAS
jgi:hypothetical protein